MFTHIYLLYPYNDKQSVGKSNILRQKYLNIFKENF